MNSKVTFRIDSREFDEALRQYVEVSTRSLPDILNKKAFFIARRAVRETPATPKDTIVSQLGRVTRSKHGVRTMLAKSSATYPERSGKAGEAPLAALIINARLGREGYPGLYGASMKAAVAELIAARSRSRGFIKSGWLPAIHKLDAVLHDRRGEPPADHGPARQYGAAKGDALPARPGFRCKAIIENGASGTHETHQALIKYGGPALQRAFNFEAASMMAEVARRQFEEAKKIGIKAVGG